MVMRRLALVARMKLLSNMANISLTVIFLQQVLRHPDEDTLKLLLSEPVSQNKNKFEDRAGEPSPLMLQNSGSLPDCVSLAITLDSFKKNLKYNLFKKFYQS